MQPYKHKLNKHRFFYSLSFGHTTLSFLVWGRTLSDTSIVFIGVTFFPLGFWRRRGSVSTFLVTERWDRLRGTFCATIFALLAKQKCAACATKRCCSRNNLVWSLRSILTLPFGGRVTQATCSRDHKSQMTAFLAANSWFPPCSRISQDRFSVN